MIPICCRTSIYPLDAPTAVAVLTVGLFKPTYWNGQSKVAVNWERHIEAEGTAVHAAFRDGSLELNLAPAISVYSQHSGKRIAASVYFEIAARYAEKVAGTIVQRATVVGCKAGGQPQELVLAEYPGQPMSFDRICAGFRAVLQGEADEHLRQMAERDWSDENDGRGRPAAEYEQLWRPGMTGPVHVCPECGATFPTDAQLITHISTVHRRAT